MCRNLNMEDGNVMEEHAHSGKGPGVGRLCLRSFAALMGAARIGHLEVVKLLIENRADVNITPEEGETAFIWAAESGNLEVEELLHNGADLNIKTVDGETALMWAAGNGHLEVVKL